MIEDFEGEIRIIQIPLFSDFTAHYAKRRTYTVFKK